MLRLIIQHAGRLEGRTHLLPLEHDEITAASGEESCNLDAGGTCAHHNGVDVCRAVCALVVRRNSRDRHGNEPNQPLHQRPHEEALTRPI